MATKDMIASGLACVEYANGARHKLSEYADMAIRTASKRAYLQGEGEKRKEWGISLVIVNKRGNPCPKCLPFCGKVLIDDVWSGGSKEDGDYPLMSKAIEHGLYHPRCRDSHTTYFKGISTADDTWTKEELEAIGEEYRQEQKQQYAKRQQEKYKRLANHSLDKDNQKTYESRARQWKRARFRTGEMNSKEYAESKRPLAQFRAVSQDKVVSLLREKAEHWISLLNDDEIKAIKKYTYNSGDKKPNKFYERLNAMLRGDAKRDVRLEKYANTISMAIKKHRLDRDIICYRSMDINPYLELSVGDIFEEGQFISTSVVEGRAFKKRCQIIIYAPTGTRAAYVEKLSKFPEQRELLIDKGNIFRVISNKKDVVELEVIP